MFNISNINNVEKNYGTTTVFQNYKVTLNNNDFVFVPLDPANSDYQAIQEWIEKGNTVIDNGGGE
jgi:hypothetical protein